MATEIEAAERRHAQLKAKLSQIAQNVSEDLMSYMSTHPQGPDFDIGVNENRITLRKKSSSNTLEIVCTGEPVVAFEVIMDGKSYPPTHERDMARGVLAWLKRATASKPL